MGNQHQHKIYGIVNRGECGNEREADTGDGVVRSMFEGIREDDCHGVGRKNEGASDLTWGLKMQELQPRFTTVKGKW